MKGIIIRAQSGFFTVKTGNGVVVCHLRGRLKQGSRQGDLASIGDWVEVNKVEGTNGIIEEIYPRQRALVRLAPGSQGAYQQVITANPDQAAFVFACKQPELRLGLLDRFLVMAERQRIPSVIVVNKIDLIAADEQMPIGFYASLGYPVFYISARSGLGIAALCAHLTDKITVFAGPSGVGKSTLLNTLIPGISLQTSEVSPATQKGRHKTVVREMHPLPMGGFVVDTPGLKALGLWDIDPQELDGYFPEMRDLVNQCQFNDCTHVHEPGCAILKAIEKGQIYASRYESYVRMRLSQEDEIG